MSLLPGPAGLDLSKLVLRGSDPGGAFAGWLPRGLKLEWPLGAPLTEECWETTGVRSSEAGRRIAWMHGELSWSPTAGKPDVESSISSRTISME